MKVAAEQEQENGLGRQEPVPGRLQRAVEQVVLFRQPGHLVDDDDRGGRRDRRVQHAERLRPASAGDTDDLLGIGGQARLLELGAERLDRLDRRHPLGRGEEEVRRLGLVAELLHEPGLADLAASPDGHGGAGTRPPDPVEALGQGGQLPPSADERNHAHHASWVDVIYVDAIYTLTVRAGPYEQGYMVRRGGSRALTRSEPGQT
ncbi:hypothetical protein GCM10027612_78650 [Microbispora bryophytorum subsp. camponoti]